MNFDENKTKNIDLNNDDNQSTAAIELNSSDINATANVNFNLQNSQAADNISDYMTGTVINDYRLESMLSKATGEAEIYLAKKGDEEAVVKYYHSNMNPKEDILKKIHNLDHPDIIKLYDFGYHKGRFFEIMEYAPGGTLADRDQDGRYKFIPMSEDKIRVVVSETVNAFKYFHEKGIVHRDIKPLNMFCRNSDGTNIIIGDFGISSDLDIEGGMSKKMTSTGSRTAGYAAPEVYCVGIDDNKSKILIGPEVDYYALGITVFELLTGINLFENRNELHVIRDTMQGRVIEDILTRPETAAFSEEIKKLLRGLLTVRHDKRWGYEEVKDWLEGKDVEVADNIPLRQFEPLKFGDRVLHSIEEIVAAIDSDRELAKALLLRADLEKWAARSGDDKLGDSITEIRESGIDDDLKAGYLIYLLDPEYPCRIDEKNTISEMAEMIEFLRKQPDTMAEMILEERKSDFYPWLETFNKELSSVIKEMVENYKREGDGSKRLSVVSNIYLSLAGDRIKPFSDEDYEIATVDDVVKIPESYRKKVINELMNKNSILYLWLTARSIPHGFIEDWDSIDKNWHNLMEILSGNIEYIREQRKIEAEILPNKLRKTVLATGTASFISLLAVLYFIVNFMSGFFELTTLSPLAYPPIPKRGTVIYENDSFSARRTAALGNLVIFQPPVSRSAVEKKADREMIPVKYYSRGIEKTGFMIKRDMEITYRSNILLLFFIPAIVMCLFSAAGIMIVLLNNKTVNFFFYHKGKIAAAGIMGTVGAASVFILPLFIYSGKWKTAKLDSEQIIAAGSAASLQTAAPSTQTNIEVSSGSDPAMNNQAFTRIYENGDRYTGEMKDGEPDGHGELLIGSGGCYKGEFKNGELHGFGVLTDGSGGSYEGEFKDGVFDGRGKAVYASGETYEGEFKNGEKDGKGIFIKLNDHRYEGEFKDDDYNGKGTVLFENGDHYEGELKNGNYDGFGVLKEINGDRYEGEFKEGEFHGKGILVLGNGDRYEGEFKDGKLDGKGVYISANGERYEGEFKDGDYI